MMVAYYGFNKKIGNISFYKGRAEQVLLQQLKPGGKYAFDVVVVDPPRAGLHPKAREAVLAHKPKKIVYVSCNPEALVRDLTALSLVYRTVIVQPVDLFPHTPHVETVVLLERRPGA